MHYTVQLFRSISLILHSHYLLQIASYASGFRLPWVTRLLMAAYIEALTLLDIFKIFHNVMIKKKCMTRWYAFNRVYGKSDLSLYKLTWPAPDKALTWEKLNPEDFIFSKIISRAYKNKQNQEWL